MREIIVDNFAGGGGASTGIELAIGRSVDIAINHDPAAIAMHRANHPETEHYCENVWEVDPVKAAAGRPIGLAWFSPDCKHFSKAKGGKPVEKKIRGLAWIVLKWAGKVRPRVIILENVEEFKTWGPVRNGRPVKSKKGQTFEHWKAQLESLGYKVESRELRACDYGAPTIRKRFFLIARRDGVAITWPEPTHGDPNSEEVKSGRLKPWRTAGEIIDWSIPCPSIFGRQKPLAENTMRRIARGIQKFVIENPDPFIVPDGIAFLAKHYGGNYTGAGSSLDDPLHTVTVTDHNALVTAFLAQYYTETAPGETRGQTLDSPIMTIPTANRYALVTSHLLKLKGQEYGASLDKPLHTVTAGGNNFGEVRAFLMKYYGNEENGQTLNEPLHTITTKDRFGLITLKGVNYRILDIGMRMLEPRELFGGQGFPSSYIIDVDADGKKYPKSAQVARCGNAVPPQFSEVLVRANLPELCTGSGRRLALERYRPAAGQLQFSM
ncbi:DNA cytosine methyltransferase [Paenibacillus apis]|uniref:DNA (cytosine-5-)-methyltransferase n=1 Tax=Paenibacillus apis TaxID=1792174 RepID=A0A920CKG4_9BACL|nr:DNA cytosine methyltransferase [Paenibacillus apis]GIO42505.1 type II DNA modification methyltransferase [Paenibacillus apis]